MTPADGRGGNTPVPPGGNGAGAASPGGQVAADHCRLGNGTPVEIRAIRPGDIGLERAFITALSPRSRHLRFMSGFRELPPGMLARFVNVDAVHDLAFIAVTRVAGEEVEIGVSRYFSDAGGKAGEFAIAVADAWQGLGLGRLLLGRIVSAALAHGLEKLNGQVLVNNAPMLGLCRSFGFAIARQDDADDVCDVCLNLRPGPQPPP